MTTRSAPSAHLSNHRGHQQHTNTSPQPHRTTISSSSGMDTNESPTSSHAPHSFTARSRQLQQHSTRTTRSSNNSPRLQPSNHHNTNDAEKSIDIDFDDAEGRARKYALKTSTPITTTFRQYYNQTIQPSCIKILTYLIPACIVIYSMSYLLSLYHDMGKSDDYTIVGVLTDFGPTSMKKDPYQYAFQYTALQSWAALVVGYRLLVFADNADACNHIRTLVSGVNCQALRCPHIEYERPLMSCLMQDITQHVTTDILVFVHGDQNIAHGLSQTVSAVASKHTKLMAVAQTHPTILYDNLKDEYTKDDFHQRLFQHAKDPANIQVVSASSRVRAVDLFIMSKNVITQPFPSFLYGIYRWDSWFLSSAILDDSIAVIDVTDSVFLVEQHPRTPATPSKVGTAYNDQLVKSLSGNGYKIGTVDNSAYRLTGVCPSCTELVNVNVSNVVIFTKRASPEGYLVVLTVNSGYVDLALNWVCWAERIQFRNYILIAEDQLSAIKFRARNCPIIVDQNAPNEKAASDYGTVAFQETMSFRTEFLMSVLTAGFHFVTADMDGLWLDDPIQYFNEHVDLQGQLHKETKISGGLVIVRATSYGKYFWQQVIDCQRANAIFLSTHVKGTYEPAKYTEQYCINELSHGLSSQPLFSKSLLDPYLFPDGKSFFDLHNSQLRGIAPALIHNNWIVGTKNKLNRLKEWKLNSADEEKETCHDILLNPRNNQLFIHSKMTIKVKIITDGKSNIEHLIRLLGQLKASDYDGDHITVEVSVDMTDSTNTEEVARRGELVRLANEQSWSALTVTELSTRQGPLNHWTFGWDPPITDDEMMVMMDPSTQISPKWYIWLKRVIQQYYLNSTEYDPRLWSIGLSRPQLIIGETHDMRFGQRVVEEVVKGRTLFKYQLVTLQGIAFLPAHWRAFTSWVHQQMTAKASPCVPTFVSNAWFASDPNRHFVAWFHRYAYENGLYTLYTNFDDSAAFALSTVILDDPSVTLPPKVIAANQNVQLIQNETLRIMTLPLSKNIGVYDFHFRLVNVVATLSWRQYLSPAEKIDQCWIVDRLDAKLKADALKVENEKRDKILAKRAADEEAKMKKDQEKLSKQSKPSSKSSAAAASTTAVVTAATAHAGPTGPRATAAKPPKKATKPTATAKAAATAAAADTVTAAAADAKPRSGPPRRVKKQEKPVTETPKSSATAASPKPAEPNEAEAGPVDSPQVPQPASVPAPGGEGKK